MNQWNEVPTSDGSAAAAPLDAALFREVYFAKTASAAFDRFNLRAQHTADVAVNDNLILGRIAE